MIKQSKSTQIGIAIIALTAIITGFYPVIFTFIPSSRGLFETKPDIINLS